MRWIWRWPRPDAMNAAGAGRHAAGLLGYGALVATAAAAVSPWAFWLCDALWPGMWPFHRVFNRVLMVAALVFLWPLLRFWGVASWERIGVRWTGRGVVHGAVWAGVGMGLLAVLAGVQLLLGVRAWVPELDWGWAGQFLLTGLLVGVLEEILFRGAFCLSFARLRPLPLALVVLAGSVFFAVVHYLKAPPWRGAVHWESGWVMLGRMLERLGQAEAMGREWLVLLVLGVVLCLLALRHGHLWGAVGLHAGAVAGLKMGERLTDWEGPESAWFGENFLTGHAPLAFLVLAGVWILYAQRREPLG